MEENRKIQVDGELIGKLAALSAVELSPGESESLEADLRVILGYVERLGDLDIPEAQTRFEAGEDNIGGRPDTPAAGLAREEAFRNAPDIQGPFFKAPPIMERQDL
jgi:aspartyl-tRNA(Asn)/glutamyl-tRNA(Gln) amidotransferase subunit C